MHRYLIFYGGFENGLSNMFYTNNDVILFTIRLGCLSSWGSSFSTISFEADTTNV